MTRQPAPDILATLMAPFAACFTRPTFANVLVLVAGAILAPGEVGLGPRPVERVGEANGEQRTVGSALSSIGRRGDPTFSTYPSVLNYSRWAARAMTRCLLGLLVEAFVPNGPVVIGIDETIERRWGAKIKARGTGSHRGVPRWVPVYRDPVRSSKGHFVQASGEARLGPWAAEQPGKRAEVCAGSA